MIWSFLDQDSESNGLAREPKANPTAIGSSKILSFMRKV